MNKMKGNKFMMNRNYLRTICVTASLLVITSLQSVQAFENVEVQCESTIKGSSGSGQEFNFLNRLTVIFKSADEASLKYFSETDGNNQYEDGGSVTNRGATLPSEPDYIVLAGKDTVEDGYVAFAVPKDVLQKSPGTHFIGFFQTLETDAVHLKLNQKMACKIK